MADLKKILVNKLLKLTERYTSEGVKDYMGAEVISKGAKFSASDFSDMDFTAIQLSNWTKDEHTYSYHRLCHYPDIFHQNTYLLSVHEYKGNQLLLPVPHEEETYEPGI